MLQSNLAPVSAKPVRSEQMPLFLRNESGEAVDLLAFTSLLVVVLIGVVFGILAWDLPKWAWVTLFVLYPMCFWFAYEWVCHLICPYQAPNPPVATTEIASENVTSVSSHVGCGARTSSPLKPTGQIEIDGIVHEATSEAGFVYVNTPVTVVAVKNNTLVVREE